MLSLNHFRSLSIALATLIILAGCKAGGDKLFEQVSPSSSGIGFSNGLPKRERLNILYYLYYYNGGGVAAGDINNDGLTDLYFTSNNKGGNKLYLNRGNFTFEDITDKAGVAGGADWSSGATMADVNGDGLLDIYVGAVARSFGLNGRNELYINKGNGEFSEQAQAFGLDFSGMTTQSAFFDYDHDGDLDCYILNQSRQPHQNITDTANRRKVDELSGDRLYRNDNGKFTDVSATAGIYQSNLGYGLGLAVADLNNDGWEDIYVGNDFHENDYYYVNNGNGSFTESGAGHFGHYSRFSMGNDIADYNNDGQPDIITVDMLPPDEKTLKTYGSDENPDIYTMKLTMHGYQNQYSRNVLQRNNGNGSSFSDVALLGGVSATDWSWSPLFADFDNDGNKDLFISSGIVKRPVDLDYVMYVSDMEQRGLSRTDKFDDEVISKMPDGASHPFLFRGDGKGAFEDVSEAWGTAAMKGYFNGSAYADLDNDGRLDIVINQLEGKAIVLKNKASGKGFISLAFKGDGGNTKGIGAKAYIYQEGKIQYQQMMPTRGFQSASEPRLHFGIDSAKAIDSIVVAWPDGALQVITHARANTFITADRKNASGSFDAGAHLPRLQEILVQDSSSAINTRHAENMFFDHNVQYLIPHALSTRGPKIAVGDVNGDGRDDYYLCGAKSRPGQLMVQDASGGFRAMDTALLLNDAYYEDVDARFFDADNNGSQDLYVVSGGNEYGGDSEYLLDRLYLNDGKGNLTKTFITVPGMSQNKSCVSAADVDRDGDQDLFVGTLVQSEGYGLPQTSYLLINDGKGKFSASQAINLTNIGMVTAGAFADLNKDGWPDLVLTGEWMPIVVFMNNKGSFSRTDIAGSTGMWQSLHLSDVNGDGNPDLLAGNWGWNNKFRSGKDGPVRMYVSDFDRNGKLDQLVSYTIGGVEYPYLNKDEVERAMPVLKKHYLRYTEFAGLNMKDAYYGFVDTMKPLMAERLGSVVGLGDGKGGFTLKDLPAPLQLAPIFSFADLGGGRWMAGGNFYNVTPYEGRYDGQSLAVMQFSKDEPVYIQQPGLLALRGQVRDIQWINTAKGKRIIVARNNEKLITYRIK